MLSCASAKVDLSLVDINLKALIWQNWRRISMFSCRASGTTPHNGAFSPTHVLNSNTCLIHIVERRALAVWHTYGEDRRENNVYKVAICVTWENVMRLG